MYLHHVVVGQSLPEVALALAQHISLFQAVCQCQRPFVVFLACGLGQLTDGLVHRLLLAPAVTSRQQAGNQAHCRQT